MLQKLKRQTKEAKKNNFNLKNNSNFALNKQKFKLMSNLGSPKYQNSQNLKLFHKTKTEKYSQNNDFSQNNNIEQQLRKPNVNLRKHKNVLKYPQSTKNINRKTNFFKDNIYLVKKEKHSDLHYTNKRDNSGNFDHSKKYETSYNFKNPQLKSDSLSKKKSNKNLMNNNTKSNPFYLIT